MYISRLLALFSWLNTFALLWTGLLYPIVTENRWFYVFVFLLFLVVATAASAIDSQKR